MQLNEKQIRFCQEYVVDLNATQAAIRAGYKVSSAKRTAHNLMQCEDVKAHLQHLQQQISDKLQINAEKVIQELSFVAFARLNDFVGDDMRLKNFSTLAPEKFAALESFTVTETNWPGGSKTTASVKLQDKLEALGKLGRHLGLFDKDKPGSTEKINVIIAGDDL
jgi:phage terminase small subunit